MHIRTSSQVPDISVSSCDTHSDQRVETEDMDKIETADDESKSTSKAFFSSFLFLPGSKVHLKNIEGVKDLIIERIEMDVDSSAQSAKKQGGRIEKRRSKRSKSSIVFKTYQDRQNSKKRK